ncbi:MAG: hypothetical protein WD046_11215 [Paracoccaceae bacterium]
MSIVIAQMYVSPLRRIVGLALQLLMGAGLIYVAAATPPASPVFIVLLLVIGGALLFGAWRFWLATSAGLVLTDTDLRDSHGTVICTLDEIDKIERGTFAIKPANGFTLRMKSRQRRGWAPGLWWRLGKMVGIGGATNRNAAKSLAEAIDVLKSPRGAELIAQARTDQPRN